MTSILSDWKPDILVVTWPLLKSFQQQQQQQQSICIPIYIDGILTYKRVYVNKEK